MEIVLIIFLLILLGFIGISLVPAFQIVYPKMKTEEQYKDVYDTYKPYDKNWYDSLDKDEFYIKSQFGYDIYLNYVKNPAPTQHTIIICHGVTVRSETVIKYLDMVFKNGYNALFIDHRAHGKTGGKNVSYGYFEKHDLAKAIQWVKNKHTGKIGLIGESMGAGIIMQTLLVEQVDFIIEDCGYSSFGEEVKHQIRRKKTVPVYPTYYFIRLFVYLLGGYDLDKSSPVEALRQSDTPVMIIHGDKDDYVPYYMASIIYDNVKSENKMFYVAEGSDHAFAYQDHPEEYQKQVHKFLQSIGMPHSKEFVA